MKKLLIILLFVASVAGAQVINQYGTLTSGIRNVSAGTLPDMKGSANGTIAGATGGTNGYLTFAGNNGVTAGNRQRVNIDKTTYAYNYNSSYSFVCIFKTANTNSNSGFLFSLRGSATNTGAFWGSLVNNTDVDIDINTVIGTQRKLYKKDIAFADSKWHIMIVTYSTNALTISVDGVAGTTLTVNQSITSGAFINAANAMVLGAGYVSATTNYQYDVTADISCFINISAKLTTGQIADIINEANLLY